MAGQSLTVADKVARFLTANDSVIVLAFRSRSCILQTGDFLTQMACPSGKRAKPLAPNERRRDC